MNAAPPTSAAAPIAPTCLTPAAVGVELPVELAPVGAAPDAPLKLGAPAVAVGLGVAVELPGLRTLSKETMLGARSSHQPRNEQYLLVDHMRHTVGNENVSDFHLGVVDENATVAANSDCDGSSLESWHGSVLQGGAVGYGAGNNVVLKDGRKLLG